MIYAIIALAVLVLVMYACGCFLMRALLKEIETTDKDDLYPVLFWPWLMIAAVGDLIISRNFKW
ncbi:hypothetical protein LLE89_10150 [Staphylococcus epidermidis]|uniref:hypothetical protein n=1 Tax=Staphylococcus epidermidis TaxID=1282 RepID=UPI001E55F5AD|nr:hypothetical protein [Staphylococcus epidermidis]MCC3754015.1 hypothetical protein [Staphylococcus epidermidis]